VADSPTSSRDALLVAATLAFTAGFADASTFVGADGVFCAHVTGNFVVLAADLATHVDRGEWLKLATFPIFVAAVLFTTWLGRASDKPLDAGSVRRLLLLKAALISAAAILGLTCHPSRPGPARAAIVALLVAAMGVQNAVHRLRPTLGVMTTVMTGNVTSWVAGVLLPTAPGDRAKRRLLGVVTLVFAVGCVGGAFGVARLGFGALVVPAMAALVARWRVR
jgi:uncharacterized membrane protein YoaK (UPF0700 family)